MVYYLAFVAGMGATGIWVGMATGNVIGAIAAALWFTRGTWKETVIDEEETTDATETAGGVTPETPGGPTPETADSDLAETSGTSEGN